MLNLIFFGAPGVGKGTQAEKIVARMGLIHISTGDLFRENLSQNTPLGQLAKSYMDKGELVPDNVTTDMLKAKIEEYNSAKGFVFDGFPRTISQAEQLDALLGEKDQDVSAVIALEASDDVLIKRLLNRGKDSGRADDQDESIIQNRLREYYDKTQPVKDYYANIVKLIDGVGDIDEITDRIAGVITEIM